jgi:hypothetical protein
MNAAHSSAIFRRVVSSNDRTIPLDYNTPAIDEMPKRCMNRCMKRYPKNPPILDAKLEIAT